MQLGCTMCTKEPHVLNCVHPDWHVTEIHGTANQKQQVLCIRENVTGIACLQRRKSSKNTDVVGLVY
jgi:hypothetical protein